MISRLIAAPMAPLSNRAWQTRIRTRFISGFTIVAPAMTHVHIAWRFFATRIWLTRMFRYMGGTTKARIARTGAAWAYSAP